MIRGVESVGAILLGLLAAALAAISHAAVVPVGLIVAVLGSFAVVRLVGVRTEWRPAPILAAISWFIVIYQASTEGFGGEILVWDSTVSILFLMLGSLAVIVGAVLPIDRR